MPFEYIDTEANTTRQRYYRISSVRFGRENLSRDIVGKYDLEVVGKSALTFSCPFKPFNASLNEVIRPAQGYDPFNPDTIRILYGNNEQKVANWFGPEYGWYSFNAPYLDQIEQNVGYYAYPINNSYNITFSGKVITNGNITFQMLKDKPITIGISSPKSYNLSKYFKPLQAYDPINPDTARMLYGNNLQKVANWFGPEYDWYSFNAPYLHFIEPTGGYYLFPINKTYNATINLDGGVYLG